MAIRFYIHTLYTVHVSMVQLLVLLLAPLDPLVNASITMSRIVLYATSLATVHISEKLNIIRGIVTWVTCNST